MINTQYTVAGALTGFVVGLTGVGGGALMTPILLLFFGVPPTTAIATDLWFAAITKSVAIPMHNNSGQVDWQVVKRLWMGSLPTALFVVIAVTLGSKVYKLEWLTKGIGLVVLITSIGILLAPKLLKISRMRRINEPSKFKQLQPSLTIFSGIVLGLCIALTSVGAGALGSVMLMYLYPLRMTPHRLVATDLMHAIPLAILAGSGYLFAGLVDWKMLMSLLVGSIPAIIVGSLITRQLSGRWMQIVLAFILLLVALKALL